jgi:U6 snRNA-associated Sm-like protein LSm6
MRIEGRGGERMEWNATLTQGTHAGILSCLDGYMNIAMEQTEEHVGGSVVNRYGDAFIRGNNGASLVSFFLWSLLDC